MGRRGKISVHLKGRCVRNPEINLTERPFRDYDLKNFTFTTKGIGVPHPIFLHKKGIFPWWQGLDEAAIFVGPYFSDQPGLHFLVKTSILSLNNLVQRGTLKYSNQSNHCLALTRSSAWTRHLVTLQEMNLPANSCFNFPLAV